MKGTASNPSAARCAIALAAVSLTLGAPAPASAQRVTAGALVDRAQIEDLLTRYYYNFGKAGGESFGSF